MDVLQKQGRLGASAGVSIKRALSQSAPRICFAFSHLELVYFKGYQAANVAKGKNCYRLYLAENQQR